MGSDYVLDSSPRGIAQMTKAEKLKLIFEALDKKNKEMNAGKGIGLICYVHSSTHFQALTMEDTIQMGQIMKIWK